MVELVLLSEAEACAGLRLAAADLVVDFAFAFVLPSAGCADVLLLALAFDLVPSDSADFACVVFDFDPVAFAAFGVVFLLCLVAMGKSPGSGVPIVWWFRKGIGAAAGVTYVIPPAVLRFTCTKVSIDSCSKIGIRQAIVSPWNRPQWNSRPSACKRATYTVAGFLACKFCAGHLLLRSMSDPLRPSNQELPPQTLTRLGTMSVWPYWSWRRKPMNGTGPTRCPSHLF